MTDTVAIQKELLNDGKIHLYASGCWLTPAGGKASAEESNSKPAGGWAGIICEPGKPPQYLGMPIPADAPVKDNIEAVYWGAQEVVSRVKRIANGREIVLHTNQDLLAKVISEYKAFTEKRLSKKPLLDRILMSIRDVPLTAKLSTPDAHPHMRETHELANINAQKGRAQKQGFLFANKAPGQPKERIGKEEAISWCNDRARVIIEGNSAGRGL